MAQSRAIEVLGMHPVPGVDRCYLIEAEVRGVADAAEIGEITQPSNAAPSEWQVAYDEKLLSSDGQSVDLDLFRGERPDEWPATARITFYLHEVDAASPLITPWGAAPLPAPSPAPPRLEFLTYEEP